MRLGNILFGFALLSLSVFGLSSDAQAQIKIDDEFSKLSAESKTDLFLRIQSLIAANRSERWGDVYDMYWRTYVTGVNGLNKLTKNEYIQAETLASEREETKLCNFVPLSVRLVSFENEGVTVVIVEGCGQYRNLGKKGKSTKVLSTVTAFLEDKTWFFDKISPLRCLGCPLRKC